MHIRISLFCIVLLGLLMSCGQGPTLAGSGSESPNALTGTIRISATETASSALISLYEISESEIDSGTTDYLWTLKASTQTDSNGVFRIDSMKAGYYSFIAEHHEKKAFSGYFSYHSEDTLLNIGTFQVTNTRNIQGTIHDTSSNGNKKILVLGLVGTPYTDTISDNETTLHFDSIPEGDYNFRILSVKEVQAQQDTLPYFSYIINTSLNHNTPTGNDTLQASIKPGQAFSRSDSLITVPWATNASYNSMLILLDAVKLNVENYQIEYTTTLNE